MRPHLRQESDYIASIDSAVQRAAAILDLVDVQEEDDEDIDLAYEERFHCGTCIVRTVMDEVWPSIEAYIDFLSHKHD